MGIISKEKVDELYWLGRYIERAYTSIKEFMKYADKMIDGDDLCYKELCEQLGMLDTYLDSQDFRIKFPFDDENDSSIISCIRKTMDNAMILRETIGSEPLSYLQLAYDEMKQDSINKEEASFIKLQKILDLILAFFGIIEDEIDNEVIRNTIKVGKRHERLDLMVRFNQSSKDAIISAMKRLRFRLEKASLSYNVDVYNTLNTIIMQDSFDKQIAISLVRKIVEI